MGTSTSTSQPEAVKAPPARARLVLKRGDQVGNYIIERPLGSGGQADVFLARDVVLRRSVALKILFSTEGPNVRGVEEARLIATLDHPNIVRVFHVQLHQGTWSMAMEYVDGTNLDARIKRVGALSSEQALRFALAASDALEHAHQIGVVHRDVKPQNLLISRAGVLKLADFGLASFVDPDHPTAAPGFGTPQFMAPEVWQGENATAQSDLYSLGATLLFMLTGGPPFSGATVELLRKAHLNQQPRVGPEVPAPVAEVILRCLAKRPKGRFASAGELAQALRGCLSALGIESPRDGRISITDSLADSKPSPGGYSQNSRASADFAVLDLPHLASAIDRLDKTLAAGAPVVLVHGPQPDTLERVARTVLEANRARIYLAARVALTPTNPGLVGNIAQRLRLEKLGQTAVERIVAELEPAHGTSLPIPGLVQLSFSRPPTHDDAADLLELALAAHGKPVLFMVQCDADAAKALIDEFEGASQLPLLRDIEVRGMSVGETIRYAELWSSTATYGQARWTADALRFLAHTEMERRAPLERLLHNSIMLGQLAHLPFLTSWSVLGASAHPRYIHSVEDVSAPWRERPTLWPDAETLAILLRLRPQDLATPDGSAGPARAPGEVST